MTIQLNSSEPPLSSLRFHCTTPISCNYLADRQSASLVAIPPQQVNSRIYGLLVRYGFRRSGYLTYRPACGVCQACIPVRVPIREFVPNRSQRRCMKQHGSLRERELPLLFSEEHYKLYLRYQAKRHPGGGMEVEGPKQYTQYLLQSHVDSQLIEFRENDELRMVSIVDVLSDGLSSVYTFFDPDIPGTGFGTYGILWQINQCLVNDLPYLYMGYWIRDCQKMSYKAHFKPIEGLIEGKWQKFDAGLPFQVPCCKTQGEKERGGSIGVFEEITL